jgi:hypothetical protein
MKRRLLLSTMPAALLAACSTSTTTLTPAQVVTDAQNAISALANTFSAVLTQAPNAVPTNTSATITSALAQASSVLGSLSTSLTATVAAPIVQRVEQAINTVITAAAAVPLIPPPVSTALGAAAIVLPILEAFVNSILPAPAGAPVAAMAARAKVATPGMTAPQAEETLKQLAGK